MTRVGLSYFSKGWASHLARRTLGLHKYDHVKLTFDHSFCTLSATMSKNDVHLLFQLNIYQLSHQDTALSLRQDTYEYNVETNTISNVKKYTYICITLRYITQRRREVNYSNVEKTITLISRDRIINVSSSSTRVKVDLQQIK